MDRGSVVQHLVACVSEKLEEVGFKGAVRLASSDGTIAPENDVTYRALLN